MNPRRRRIARNRRKLRARRARVLAAAVRLAYESLRRMLGPPGEDGVEIAAILRSAGPEPVIEVTVTLPAQIRELAIRFPE